MKNLIYTIKQLTKKKNDFDELTDKIKKKLIKTNKK